MHCFGSRFLRIASLPAVLASLLAALAVATTVLPSPTMAAATFAQCDNGYVLSESTGSSLFPSHAALDKEFEPHRDETPHEAGSAVDDQPEGAELRIQTAVWSTLSVSTHSTHPGAPIRRIEEHLRPPRA